ncbi:imidazolonepropionase [Haloarculaceae archaeon H-GB2-1]|nr:imidazolonepropionase [Haloarculaceae archaeon H-GB1-1]MEA5387672.1 imidazolonepropionase [Haloarculaceae archaeon H-GB11]MEA5409157.1 imidazolonepropionase [Haloarculaceae archaeon H-GB2-1]
MSDLTTVVHGANELVVGPGDDPLETYGDGALAVVDGEVAAVGPTADVLREYPAENAAEAIDASGRAVVPGFVDPHTHALFAGDRSDEFAAKLRGKSYQDILAEGGGILRTVRAVREADAETLLANLLGHLDTMLANGTTTVEVKSGYGLDTETELRMLDVIEQADRRHPVDVVPTFMGAHAIPQGRDGDDYTDEVVAEQIPAVESQGIAEFCDVFCEEGVFTVEQSRRVLRAGEEAGMTPKVHAEELAHVGGTQLAAELEAASADHLLYATDDDIDALVEAGVTPVLLPGTAFGLGAEYADAEAFLDAGAPVAVATDFNPNCHAHSMGFAMSLSCVEMGMTPADALVAGTRNAALALDRTAGLGTLSAGAPADFAVLDAPTHVHVPYQYGTNVVDTVCKAGETVVEGGDSNVCVTDARSTDMQRGGHHE